MVSEQSCASSSRREHGVAGEVATLAHSSTAAVLTRKAVYAAASVMFLAQLGCASPKISDAIALQAPAQVVELKGRYQREYVLGSYDELDIEVRDEDELTRAVTIGPDGTIWLPIAGRVQAAGLTVTELRDELTKRFAERLVEPEVTVAPVSVREPRVYVLGQVQKPGPVPHKEAATVLEAVASAGDMTNAAIKGSLSLIRLGEDNKIRVTQIEPPDGSQPGAYLVLSTMVLEPEDIVFVSESRLSMTSRYLAELTSPFVAIANVLQPYLQLKLIEGVSD